MDSINNLQLPEIVENSQASSLYDQSNDLPALLIIQDVENISLAPIADLLHLSKDYIVQIDNGTITLEPKQEIIIFNN